MNTDEYVGVLINLNGELKTVPFATVKGNELDCYNWEDGESLAILGEITDLDKERGVFLYRAYNITRKEFGGVTSDQIIMAVKGKHC